MKNYYKYIYKNENDYVRVQAETSIPMDSTDNQSLDSMEALGSELWIKEKEKIMTLVRNIIDEKIGGKNKNRKQLKKNNAVYSSHDNESTM